jgi:hypothetical protein
VVKAFQFTDIIKVLIVGQRIKISFGKKGGRLSAYAEKGENNIVEVYRGKV